MSPGGTDPRRWALGHWARSCSSCAPGARGSLGAGSCIRVFSSTRSLQSASALKETSKKNKTTKPNPLYVVRTQNSLKLFSLWAFRQRLLHVLHAALLSSHTRPLSSPRAAPLPHPPPSLPLSLRFPLCAMGSSCSEWQQPRTAALC